MCNIIVFPVEVYILCSWFWVGRGPSVTTALRKRESAHREQRELAAAAVKGTGRQRSSQRQQETNMDTETMLNYINKFE